MRCDLDCLLFYNCNLSIVERERDKNWMEEVEWILLNLKLKFRIFCATEENFLFIFQLEEDIEIFNLRIMYVITILF